MLPRAEHVWVTDSGWSGGRVPALLLGWDRHRDGTWRGWCIVVYPGIGAHAEGPYVRQGWVRAESIRPR